MIFTLHSSIPLINIHHSQQLYEPALLFFLKLIWRVYRLQTIIPQAMDMERWIHTSENRTLLPNSNSNHYL